MYTHTHAVLFMCAMTQTIIFCVLLWYSVQHQPDLAIGVHLMDRYTFYLLEFLEDIQPASKANMNDLVSVCVCAHQY